MSERMACTSRLWRWAGTGGSGSWYFVTVTQAADDALTVTAVTRKLEGMARGFGSLKVAASIGGSHWRTSVFPSREHGWMLPVKAAVRKAEGLGEGDLVAVTLEV